MDIKVLNSEIKNQTCDLMILGTFENEKSNILNEIDNELCGLIQKFVFDKDKFEAKLGSTYLLQTYEKIPANKILIIGLGKKCDFNTNKLRELSAKITKKLLELKAKTACIDFGELPFCPCDSGEFISEGLLIAEYAFDKYKTKDKDKKPKIEKIILVEKDAEKAKNLKKGINKGITIANAMNFARDLSNEPAEFVTPTKLAEIAKKLDGIKTKIYEKDDIQDMGMGAFYAVSKGSAEFPKFIHMKYETKNPKKKIALIGKGLTFDSGGMDLKPAASMLDMRDDMSGSACILAIMSMLKKFAPNVEVHGIIAACENMVSGSSYKPGDILTAKNGKTIEIDNTDAEGRLTLADALCYACELKVDEVIDIATLTGACMVAFGTICSGLLGNNSELTNMIKKIGEEQGERFWELPTYPEYFENIKSDIADMKNTGGRMGGASTAGVFLREFVTNDVKWAHIDIAGTAFLNKPQKEFIKGATGVGIRTLINYLIKQ